MSYVDGFVLAVPKDKIEEYKKFSERGADLWREHGALAYKECVADDVKPGKVTSFPQSVKAEDNEVVVFSWISYESREHRDAVNAKVMADPRMSEMDPKNMPFDGKRMIYGGFKMIVDR
ncbi:MAG TPA: DUF1428 domain-containing protein [Polyangiales bacterium]|nr:DUF1428 domain-containing protein [Polyangiales bacterium]